MKNPIGSKVVVSGWPWVFMVTGVKISTRRTRERLIKVSCQTDWAASLTTIVPESKVKRYTDHRAARA